MSTALALWTVAYPWSQPHFLDSHKNTRVIARACSFFSACSGPQSATRWLVACRVVKLVRALRKGWLKPRSQRAPQEEEAPPYLMWEDDGMVSDKTAIGGSAPLLSLLAMRLRSTVGQEFPNARAHGLIPCTAEGKLPGHACKRDQSMPIMSLRKVQISASVLSLQR